MPNKYRFLDGPFWFAIAFAAMLVLFFSGCASSAGSVPHTERVAQCARNGGLVVVKTIGSRIQTKPYYVSCN